MRFLNTVAGSALALGLLTQSILPGWSDVIHFRDGQTFRGSLGRITGDIIEFKRQDAFPLFGNMETIERLRLTDRRDMVETRNQQKYFGEIIYVDKFKLELRTASGNMGITRLNIRNIVLGSPLEGPNSTFSSITPSDQKGMVPVSYQPKPGSTADTADRPSPESGADDSHDHLPMNP
jgi:hypothetical protein